MWKIRMRVINWRVTRRMSKRHVDRNHANLRKVLREINTDKHLLVLNEVFGGGDIFCKAFQMDRSLCTCINNCGHKRPLG